MNIALDTMLKKMDDTRCKAGIHLSFGAGSFTVSNILIRLRENGRYMITLPLVQIGSSRTPAVTLQGPLKQVVMDAIIEAHRRLLESGEKTLTEHRLYDEAFQPIDSEAK